jgi:hypothetical protein
MAGPRGQAGLDVSFVDRRRRPTRMHQGEPQQWI